MQRRRFLGSLTALGAAHAFPALAAGAPSRTEDCAQGADVLLGTILELDRSDRIPPAP